MKCPSCSKEVPEDAKVCGFCGTKLEIQQDMKKCGKCGAEVNAAAKFCDNCGAALAPPPVPTEKAKPAASARKKTKPAPPKKKAASKPKQEVKAEPAPPAQVAEPESKPAKELPSKLPKWLLPLVFAALALLAIVLIFFLHPKPLLDIPPQASSQQASAPQPAATQGEEISFNVAQCPDPLVISDQDTLNIQASWTAATSEQVIDHERMVIYDMDMDGQIFSFSEQSEIYASEDGYRMDFSTRYGPLEPGTHTLSLHEHWKEAIWDGWDEYGPGTELEEYFFSCRIIVE